MSSHRCLLLGFPALAGWEAMHSAHFLHCSLPELLCVFDPRNSLLAHLLQVDPGTLWSGQASVAIRKGAAGAASSLGEVGPTPPDVSVSKPACSTADVSQQLCKQVCTELSCLLQGRHGTAFTAAEL